MSTQRTSDYKINKIFTERWSPRIFKSEPIPQETIKQLIEAARWAPSSMNEQPWRFYYAIHEKERNQFLACLSDKNQRWAQTAPALLFLAAKNTFSADESPNPKSFFDSGAAWMSLALQAQMMGLHTHPIGGFDKEKAYTMLGLDRNEYTLIIAIAVGHIDEPANKKYVKSTRKSLDEISTEFKLTE